MVILNFLLTLLWIAMLIGFLVAVIWVIAIAVFVRGFKRWVHGDEIKQIEEEEGRSAVRRLVDDV
jgi:small-conductance mechanosensitive channel